MKRKILLKWIYRRKIYIIFYKIYRKIINCSLLIKEAIAGIYLKNLYQNAKKKILKYINQRVNYL